MRDLQPLVDAADEAALLRAVDGLCSNREWDVLVELARRCRDAVELGKQLWPVATHIDYRLALEAPAPYAGGVLRPGAGRFALGPLTEVAASRHPWTDLAPHIGDPASAAAVVQERVIRGEDLRGARTGLPAELPLSLMAFEPDYALPTYRDRESAFPTPTVAHRHLGGASRPAAAERLPDDAATVALRAVADAWMAESSGTVAAVAVAGPPEGAAAHLAGARGGLAIAEISARDALALLQWAGASGGAYGRRRGGAAGRFAAWWAMAALADLDWPQEPDRDEEFLDELGESLAELRWYRWAPAEGEAGWVLRLAVSDPLDGIAWAVEATDRLEDDDPLAAAGDDVSGASR